MANKKSRKILSIKPGTRHLATAVFDGSDLVYWKNRKIRSGKDSASRALRNLREVLEEMIAFWNPDLIAVEDVYYIQAKKSKLLNSVVGGIKDAGKEKRVNVRLYHPVKVREFICGQEDPTKISAAKKIAEEYYPCLYKKYVKEKKKKWYEAKTGLRIFDAVALGIYCFNKFKTKK